MSTVLYALLLMMVISAIVFGVLAGLGAWSLNRRNRLAPDLETGAPIQWLWSPTQPARLHRRLQRAVAPIHEPSKARRRDRNAESGRAIGPASTIDDVCRALTGQAIALDREVVQVSRLPRKFRRSRMRLLQGEVAQIERLTVRVHQQRAEQARPATIGGDAPRTRGEALTHIDQHLDALADAHAELHAIERAHGLDDPDRILDAIESRHQQLGPAVPTPPPMPAPTRPGPPPGPRSRPPGGAPGSRHRAP